MKDFSSDISLALLNTFCTVLYIIKYLEAELHILPKKLDLASDFRYIGCFLFPWQEKNERGRGDIRRHRINCSQNKSLKKKKRLFCANTYLDLVRQLRVDFLPDEFGRIKEEFSPNSASLSKNIIFM